MNKHLKLRFIVKRKYAVSPQTHVNTATDVQKVIVLIIKPTRYTNFSNLFWNKNLHVSYSSCVHHQEFFTVHTAMVYVIQVCWQPASRIGTEPVPSRSVWRTPLLCVQWKTPDDGQRNCPKHVEFYSKNKFEKLVHLVGFIIRIYHDALSPERQVILVCYGNDAKSRNYKQRENAVTRLSVMWYMW